jgi:hypothetical protein
MKNLAAGFVLGVVLSGTLWAFASNSSMPSTPGTRPDQLWQQDRGAAVQRYLEQRQHDILHQPQLRQSQGNDLAHPC